MTYKFCKDCKHFLEIKEFMGVHALVVACKRPLAPDLVTGEIRLSYDWCENERKQIDLCGPEGQYWEAK